MMMLLKRYPSNTQCCNVIKLLYSNNNYNSKRSYISSSSSSRKDISYTNNIKYNNILFNNNNNNNRYTDNYEQCKYYSTQQQQQHHKQPRSCWSCKMNVEPKEFFCSMCNVVQAPHERINPFDIFSIKQEYKVDLKDISTRFKLLQKKLHPDLFQTLSKKEQDLSKDQATALNAAYNILRSPFLRSEFMLNDRGYDLESVTDVDPEVLMEIVEVREQIEDASEDENKIKEIAHANRLKMNQVEKNLETMFNHNQYDQALNETIYLRYLTRIQEEVHKRLGVHI